MGGRGSKSATASSVGSRGATATSSGGASGSSGATGAAGPGLGGGAQNSQIANAPTVATNVQMTNANNSNFPGTDNSAFHELKGGRAYYQSQTFSVASQTAIMEYIDPNTVSGSLYSPSQILNRAIRTGQPLNPQQAYTYKNLMAAMHNLGQNLKLTRYAHASYADRIMQDVGISGNMNTASIKDLKKMVGHTFKENRFVSTSYNDFRHANQSSTFTNRQVRIVIEAKASTQAIMPGKVGGNDLGEIILSPNTNFVIKDVREVAKTGGRISGSQSRGGRIIEIVVSAD